MLLEKETGQQHRFREYFRVWNPWSDSKKFRIPKNDYINGRNISGNALRRSLIFSFKDSFLRLSFIFCLT